MNLKMAFYPTFKSQMQDLGSKSNPKPINPLTDHNILIGVSLKADGRSVATWRFRRPIFHEIARTNLSG
jgi:hypothetical protein